MYEQIVKHYRKAQNIRRGLVAFDYAEYEIHIKCTYSYIVYYRLLDSNEQMIKNALRLYKELKAL